MTSRTAAEVLEQRTVLSSHSVLSSVAEITNIDVQDVDLANNEITFLLTGTALGRSFTDLPVTAPLDAVLELTAAEDTEAGTCDVLNLSLGPINLDVLGLQVELDDCNDGPVTIDIYGEEGPGNLLGNLVCGITGLLDPASDDLLGDLLELLDEPTPEALELLGLEALPDGSDLIADLEAVIGEALNQRFDLLEEEDADTGGSDSPGQGRGQSTSIIDLAVEEGINLDVLGLVVDTSPICLVVTANQGAGNLLGNLVGSIAHLLDRDPGNAINALLNRAERILDQIDLGDVSDELLSNRPGQGRGR